MDPEQIKAALEAIAAGDEAKALEILKALIASAAGGVPAADPASASATAETPEVPPEEEMQALARALMAATGAKTPGEAATFLASLKARVDTLDADRETLELSERRGLIAKLVKLGAETPATAWTGESTERVPCKRLALEPIADLRGRVAQIEAARPAPAGHRPPAVAGGPAQLTKEQADYCAKHALTPEQFQARRQNSVRSAV